MVALWTPRLALGTGWPGVSLLFRGEITGFIVSLSPSVAPHATDPTDPLPLLSF